MQRAWRLRAHGDFARVRSEGRSWAHPLLVLVVARGPDPVGPTRVGVSAGKRVGNAVVRNRRAKRRIREAVRASYRDLPPGWDIVIVVRSAAAEASFAALAEALSGLFQRSGLVRVTA
jgi:ribonuclease P protein component